MLECRRLRRFVLEPLERIFGLLERHPEPRDIYPRVARGPLRSSVTECGFRRRERLLGRRPAGRLGLLLVPKAIR
jgi:hypothetical protein